MSSPLPVDDPTLLFVIAGMVPLKKFYTGEETPINPRMTSSQRCLRTNDIQNVGKTPRHHTFFEMLGNFSIGDYFKEDAIGFGYELINKIFGIEQDRLWATVYPEDDEAKTIWKKFLPESRIVPSEDNFWKMADVGPSGFDSEIYVDLGKEVGCQDPNCGPLCECGRFVEIWNLVFMEFNVDKEGNRKWLPRKNIDTGMGLERISSVVNGFKSNFEIDFFAPLLERVEHLSGKERSVDPFRFNLIADHARAMTFLIADGVFPENTKHGYVLRRLMRRAKLSGHLLGIKENFLDSLCQITIDMMKDHYTNLTILTDKILLIARKEEEQFSSTLDDGFKIFEEEKKKTISEFSGKIAFKLHDTYGFPIELTREMLELDKMKLNEDEFASLYEEQRARAKKDANFESTLSETDYWVGIKTLLGETKFVGYDHDSTESQLIGIMSEHILVETASNTESMYYLLLDKTPFFAEKGGPIGDKGIIKGEGFSFDVEKTLSPIQGLIIHKGKLIKGTMTAKSKVNAIVDFHFRRGVRRAHTATHLLHAALREIVGDFVNQAGSFVEEDAFRFDFNALDPVTTEQILKIENYINEIIARGSFVCMEEMSTQKALEGGATALFKEKYGETVRVVSIDKVSKELCGGIHAQNTAELRLFRIVKEQSIGSNLRRIEAVIGDKAIETYRNDARTMSSAKKLLNKPNLDLLAAIQMVLEEKKKMEQEIAIQGNKLIQMGAGKVLDNAIPVGKNLFVYDEKKDTPVDSIKSLADILRGLTKQPLLMMLVSLGSPESTVVLSSSGEIDCKTLLEQIKAKYPLKGGGSPKMVQFGGVTQEMLPIIADICKQRLMSEG
jgi:alanyl-tRNA synthetase